MFPNATHIVVLSLQRRERSFGSLCCKEIPFTPPSPTGEERERRVWGEATGHSLFAAGYC